MFTGIIQGLGEVTAVIRLNRERRLTIRPLFKMENVEDGESIAIDGVCLSVEKHDASDFGVYASAETTQRTTLGELRQGARVNLERALELGQRLGGHIISGHVDCMATVAAISRKGQSLALRLTFPAEYSGQVIPRGSIALDGISLTVTNCGKGFLEVNIIPDSQERTNIAQWRSGDRINMETDIIGKYVQSLIRPWEAGMSREFLAMNGFA